MPSPTEGGHADEKWCSGSGHRIAEGKVKTIEIDIDVHRIIENARTSFDQSPNEILRWLLAIDRRPADAAQRPRLRASRSSGAYSIDIGGQLIEANSLKELLRRTILLLERRRPGFIAALARHSTPRKRRIVAKAPEALYPGAPHLVDLAERLDASWWFDTNVSRQQTESYLRVFAEIAHLPAIPRIAKRSEKTTLTLADLGLHGQ
jgi:hypothetical protein